MHSDQLTDQLDDLASVLNLKAEFHRAFEALARFDLRDTIRVDGLFEGDPDPDSSPCNDTFLNNAIVASPDFLDRTTVNFLLTYGCKLWPEYRTNRSHLTVPTSSPYIENSDSGSFWVEPKPLKFLKTVEMSSTQRQSWSEEHRGQEPSFDDQVLASVFGRTMKQYFAALLTDISTAESTDEDPENLLKAIVG